MPNIGSSFLDIEQPKTQDCQACKSSIAERLPSFNHPRGLTMGSGMSTFGGFVQQIIHREVPLLPRYFANHESLEEQSTPTSDSSTLWLHLDFVNGPIEFSAATVRVKCPECNDVNSIVVINSTFLQVVSYLSSALNGPSVELWGLPKRINFIRKSGVTAAEQSPVPVDPFKRAVLRGIAWILGHELAHGTGLDTNSGFSLPRVPQVTRKLFEREVGADLEALRALLSCPSADSAGFLPIRFFSAFGVQLVLAAIALVQRPDDLNFMLLSDESISLFGNPSPSLRWTHVREELFQGANELDHYQLSEFLTATAFRWEAVVNYLEGTRDVWIPA